MTSRASATTKSSSHSGTLPVSNCSAAIRCLQEDDTDDDISISCLTDDESLGNAPDF